MTHLLIDTSVLIKWFHSEGESELPEARALRTAHISGDIDVHILDLAIYEVGDVLARALRWEPSAVADQLDDLGTILGPPLVMTLTGCGTQQRSPTPTRSPSTTRVGRQPQPS